MCRLWSETSCRNEVLAIQVGVACWQIEIKDYRATRVGNFRFLADEVALKARDTLAALVAAKLNANNAAERNAAAQALACPRIRIVLHLEQPVPHSILKSKNTHRTEVLQRLKQLVKSIDARPQVVDLDSAGDVGWTVTQVGALPP